MVINEIKPGNFSSLKLQTNNGYNNCNHKSVMCSYILRQSRVNVISFILL